MNPEDFQDLLIETEIILSQLPFITKEDVEDEEA